MMYIHTYVKANNESAYSMGRHISRAHVSIFKSRMRAKISEMSSPYYYDYTLWLSFDIVV